MTKRILVHGRNANAKSWNGIEADLDDAVAVDLADRGAQVSLTPRGNKGACEWLTENMPVLTNRGSAATMADHLAIIEAALPATGPVYLIGHSMGGAVISHFAASFPDRVAKLIYITAMLPAANDTIRALQLGFPPPGNRLGYCQEFADYLEEVRAAGTPPIFSEPDKPTRNAMPDSNAFKALPKSYLHRKDDRVIPLHAQKRMVDAYTSSIMAEEWSGGHLPQYDDRADLVAWLADQTPDI